jgi:AcrR family transcriptional regulator
MRPSSLKKRQRYIEVATELFLDQGFEGTGLDQLIERCGGSKLTIYSYFGDKKGLLKAVVVELTEHLVEGLKFDVIDSESIHDQLMDFATRYIKYIYTPELMKLSRLVMTQRTNDPELVDFFLERGACHSQSVLHQFLQQQTELKRLTLDDPFLACDQLLGALKGNQYMEALFADRIPSEQQIMRYAKFAVDAFVRSYG